jgi:hypothetical protein
MLLPLSTKSLRQHLSIKPATLMYMQIADSTSMEFIKLFDEISVVKQRVNDLVNDISEYISTDKNLRSVKKLKSDLEFGERNLRDEVATKLKSVRSGISGIEYLNTLKNKYLSSDNSHEKIDEKLNTYSQAIKKKLIRNKTFKQLGIKCDTDDFDALAVSKSLRNVDVYVLYASDILIERDESAWESNHLDFLDIAHAKIEQQDKQDATSQSLSSNDNSASPAMKVRSDCRMFFVDRSNDSPVAPNDRITIKHFKNGRCKCEDVAKKQAHYLSLNVARSDEVECLFTVNDNLCESNGGVSVSKQRVPMKTHCPGSVSGECNRKSHEWVCDKCEKSLMLSIDDDYDYCYCSCGKAPVSSFKFRCSDKENHPMENFVAFDQKNMESMLQSLKPNKGEALCQSVRCLSHCLS